CAPTSSGATRRSRRARVADVLRVWRTVSEGGIRHFQYVRALGDCHRDIRSHSGLELISRIVDGENHTIGYDVLNRLRTEADLRNLSIEYIIWIGINCEGDSSAFHNVADIRFIDARAHLHSA